MDEIDALENIAQEVQDIKNMEDPDTSDFEAFYFRVKDILQKQGYSFEA